MADCGVAYNPNSITLLFSGSSLGDHIHSLASVGNRMEPIAKYANFWSSKAGMDGRYPCLVWEHTFIVYQEASNRWALQQEYYSYANSFYGGNPQSLVLKYNGNDVINFGNCYLDHHGIKEPDNLLGYSACLMELKFLGTDVPSIVTTTP